jgi:hypothetical protein
VINWKSEAREKALGLIEHQWKKADRRKQRQDTPQRTEVLFSKKILLSYVNIELIFTFFQKNIVVVIKH